MSERGREGSLQVSNRKVMNSLSTKPMDNLWNNLWVICGATVDGHPASRMVDGSPVLMHSNRLTSALFY